MGAVAAEDTGVAVVDTAVAAVSMVVAVVSMVASPAAFVVVAPTSQAEVLEAADLVEDTAEASAVVTAAMATTDMEQILPVG